MHSLGGSLVLGAQLGSGQVTTAISDVPGPAWGRASRHVTGLPATAAGFSATAETTTGFLSKKIRCEIT